MGVQHSEIEYSPPEITDTAPGRRKRFFCNPIFDSPPLEPDTRLFTYFCVIGSASEPRAYEK